VREHLKDEELIENFLKWALFEGRYLKGVMKRGWVRNGGKIIFN